MTNPFRGLKIGTRLFLIVLVMMLLTLTSSFVLYSHFESELLGEVLDQSESLSKALQISIQQLTATQGMTDASILKEYVERLSKRGVKEISILSNEKQVVASSKQSRVGKKAGDRKGASRGDQLVVTGTLSEEEAGDTESKTTTTFDIPIIVGDEKRGYVRLHLLFDNLGKMIHRAHTRRLAALVAIFLLGMAGVVALSHRLTGPLGELAAAAERVAEGDLGVRVRAVRRDEVGRLISTFNQMVERLREQRALESRLRRAERASAIGRLAAAVAHEIRNPLNLISLSVGHLGTEFRPADPAQSEEFSRTVTAVREELKRLNQMVSDFLSYGRPPRLAPRPCRVEELLDEVLSLTAAKAKEQRIEVARRLAPDLPQVKADPEALKTCFLNVVVNALQAMPTGGRLAVEAVAGHTPSGRQAVTVTIRDTGAGISPADLERILEPYFSTREAGVGLGLAITQRILEEHGGEIRVESGAGSGTAFHLDIPVQGPGGPAVTEEAA